MFLRGFERCLKFKGFVKGFLRVPILFLAVVLHATNLTYGRDRQTYEALQSGNQAFSLVSKKGV